MKIIEKNEGTKINHAVNDNKITFGDECLTLNLERYERDDEINIDICRDKSGNLLTGVIPGQADWYCAQIHIPAREYEVILGEEKPEPTPEGDESDGGLRIGSGETRTPIPFDISRCTLTLWAVNC